MSEINDELPAGWYKGPDGSERYWDGVTWGKITKSDEDGRNPAMENVASEPTQKGCGVGCLGVFGIIVVAGFVIQGFAGLSGGSESDSSLDSAISSQVKEITVPPYVPEVSISPLCDEGMISASRVPQDQPINDALMPTLSSCATYSEWASAMRQYPSILGVTDQITAPEAASAIAGLCSDVSAIYANFDQWPVCQDALATGILSPTHN